MNESDFALEIKHSLETQLKDIHYKKIPDQLFNPSSFARFNPEKDYDAYVVHNGCFTALEYKFHKKMTAFPLSNVRPIQRSSLMDVHESGGNAYIIIGVRVERIKHCFFIPIKDFLDYCNSADRKSMPVDVMKTYPSAEWIGKGIWKLNKSWFTYPLPVYRFNS